MLEKDIEELIANYPDDFFPDYNLKLIDRQGILDNTARFDLLFNDNNGNTILMELKAKKASADNIDQIITYQDKLIRKGKVYAHMWLIAPNIPFALQKRLNDFNIKFFEIKEDKFKRVAKKRNYNIKEIKRTTPKSKGTISYKNKYNLKTINLKDHDFNNGHPYEKLINELRNKVVLKPQWLNNLSLKRNFFIDRVERGNYPEKYCIYRFLYQWKKGLKGIELQFGIFDKSYFFYKKFENDEFGILVYLKNGTLNKNDYTSFVSKITSLGYYQYRNKIKDPIPYKEWFIKTFDSSKEEHKLEINNLFAITTKELSKLGNIFLEYF